VFRSGLSTRERALYERIITLLADQVDWHRLHSGTVMLPSQGVARGVSDPPLDLQKMWMDEDEETVQWQLDNDVLDLSAAQQALAQIQALNTDVEDYS
jgi:hypothetical protein